MYLNYTREGVVGWPVDDQRDHAVFARQASMAGVPPLVCTCLNFFLQFAAEWMVAPITIAVAVDRWPRNVRTLAPNRKIKLII